MKQLCAKCLLRRTKTGLWHERYDGSRESLVANWPLKADNLSKLMHKSYWRCCFVLINASFNDGTQLTAPLVESGAYFFSALDKFSTSCFTCTTIAALAAS